LNFASTGCAPKRLSISTGKWSSDMGPRVVDHVSLATARLEVIGILLSAVADGEGDRVDGHPVMASLCRDSVAGAGNRHARGLQRGVIRNGEPSVRRKPCDLRIA
jgi:hypothetical protein